MSCGVTLMLCGQFGLFVSVIKTAGGPAARGSWIDKRTRRSKVTAPSPYEPSRLPHFAANDSCLGGGQEGTYRESDKHCMGSSRPNMTSC
ncbi:hypothetical protein MHYP_G00140290 [Metynnis hypsauchen]